MNTVVLKIVSIAAGAAVLVGGGVYLLTGNTGTRSRSFTVDGTTVTVASAATGGDVKAASVSDGRPDVPGVRTLAAPVALTGTLKRAATVSFTVDPAVVPAGADPAAWLVVLVRGERTDRRWVWAGGDYDAATRRLSVEVDQLSDVAYGITDLAAVTAATAPAARQAGGLFLSRPTWPGAPPADCTPGATPLSYAVHDPTAPPLNVCFDVTEGDGGYRVELTNPHPYPMLLTLPTGLTAAPNPVTDAGVIGAIHTPAYERRTGTVLLRAHAERAFTARKDELAKNAVITGGLALEALGVDLAGTALDVLLHDHLRSRAQLGGTLEDLRAAAGDQLKTSEHADCLAAATARLTAVARAGAGAPPNVGDELYLFAVGCFEPVAAAVLDAWGERIGVHHRSADLVARRSRSFGAVPELMTAARAWGGPWAAGAAEIARWVVGVEATVRLAGKYPYTALFEVLPPAAVRENGYTDRQLLTPAGCGQSARNDWFTQVNDPNLYPVPAVEYGRAEYPVTRGAQTLGHMGVQLLRVAPEQHDAVKAWMAQLPATCQGYYTYGAPPYSLTRVASPGGGEAHTMYLVENVSPQGVVRYYQSYTYSNGFLLDVNFGIPPGSAPSEALLGEFRAVRQAVYASADRYLPTTFVT